MVLRDNLKFVKNKLLLNSIKFKKVKEKMNMEEKKPAFKCAQCSEEFWSITRLEYHINEIHEKEEQREKEEMLKKKEQEQWYLKLAEIRKNGIVGNGRGELVVSKSIEGKFRYFFKSIMSLAKLVQEAKFFIIILLT